MAHKEVLGGGRRAVYPNEEVTRVDGRWDGVWRSHKKQERGEGLEILNENFWILFESLRRL
jgi:hypothetical protein